MDKTAILNYPGSKRRLLEFILTNSKQYLAKDSIILDIFCGTGSVAKMFKNKGYNVCANDSENYSQNIAYAILNGLNEIVNKKVLNDYYSENYSKLLNEFGDKASYEDELIKNCSPDIIDFDACLQKIWKDEEGFTICKVNYKNEDELRASKNVIPYCLFTAYYSGYYFGIKQCMQIDSIRFAIEHSSNKEVLLTCLYYAMKEAIFSKDGHMAQPLNHEKNFYRLFKCRKKDIYEIFIKKIDEFHVNDDLKTSKVFNMPFEKLILDNTLLSQIDLIYADPPYTDMQYSRYFHILNTVTLYNYPTLTRKKGKVTTGLYPDNRFQSKISNKSTALIELSNLMLAAKRNNCVLMFSYAYPVDRMNQATNRYTMSIDDLIVSMKKTFSKVEIVKEDYAHCNNRNSTTKKVHEYLIIGVPDEKQK